MSSQSNHQQHLTPSNLAMIDRALARVRKRYEFDRCSDDEAQVAAVMVGEFQRGNDLEDGLVAVFLGATSARDAALRKTRIRVAIERWDKEGGHSGAKVAG